jgi:hypothetical protein
MHLKTSKSQTRNQLTEPWVVTQRIPLRVEFEKCRKGLPLVQASGEIREDGTLGEVETDRELCELVAFASNGHDAMLREV